jgi:protein transport protein SEC61 subunit alpha
MTLCESVAYIYSGMYGEVDKLSYTVFFLIIIQLFFAGVIVILLDEMLQDGYGLGNNIPLSYTLSYY